MPVRTILVPVAAPSTGVTSVGVLANTAAPVPVSSVSAEARFALDGVPRKVATPVPSPLTSLAIRTVKVLLAPLIVLFVSVSVVALPTNVSVAAGRLSVTVPSAPVTGCKVIVPLVAFRKPIAPTEVPATPKLILEVLSNMKPATPPKLPLSLY